MKKLWTKILIICTSISFVVLVGLLFSFINVLKNI